MALYPKLASGVNPPTRTPSNRLNPRKVQSVPPSEWTWSFGQSGPQAPIFPIGRMRIVPTRTFLRI